MLKIQEAHGGRTTNKIARLVISDDTFLGRIVFVCVVPFKFNRLLLITLWKLGLSSSLRSWC